MTPKLVEVYEKNKKIREEHIQFPDTIDDITVKQFADYFDVVRSYNKEQEEDQKLLEKNQITKEEIECKSVLFLSRLIATITDRDEEFYLDLSPEILVKMSEDLKFMKEPMPEEVINEFIFRDATIEEIQKAEQELKEIAWWKFKQRVIKKARIALMKERRFVVSTDFGHNSLRQWIGSNEAAKRIAEVTDQIKGNDFTNYAKLIAEIARPEGEDYDPEKVKRRTEVFNDLPFGVTYRLAGFFLGIQSVLQTKIREYLEEAVHLKRHPKQKKNMPSSSNSGGS